jgi:hypothetical protein
MRVMRLCAGPRKHQPPGALVQDPVSINPGALEQDSHKHLRSAP